jgi:hypothetical protein
MAADAAGRCASPRDRATMHGMAFPRLSARLLLPAMLALAIACGDDASDDAADSVAVTSAGSATASPATADDASTAEPSPCGDMCGLSEVCVVNCPCPPLGTCFQRPAIGDCGMGTLDVGGVNCCADSPDPQMCMELDWCRTGPCPEIPPACVPEDDVSCTEDLCVVDDGCSGQLDNGVLSCEVCE